MLSDKERHGAESGYPLLLRQIALGTDGRLLIVTLITGGSSNGAGSCVSSPRARAIYMSGRCHRLTRFGGRARSGE